MVSTAYVTRKIIVKNTLGMTHAVNISLYALRRHPCLRRSHTKCILYFCPASNSILRFKIFAIKPLLHSLNTFNRILVKAKVMIINGFSLLLVISQRLAHFSSLTI